MQHLESPQDATAEPVQPKKKSCNNNYNILYHYIERNIRYNGPPSKPDPDIGDAILISSLLPQSSPKGFLDFPVKKKV